MLFETTDIYVFAGGEKQGCIAPYYFFSSRHFGISSGFIEHEFVVVIICGKQVRI